MRKKLPIGIENFEEFLSENFYYVDKTLFIKELLQNWGKVNQFTRPRRFGKSLNMSMLKCFFEIGSKPALFEGLKIMQEKELCEKYMGKFPVISISLKNVDGLDFKAALAALKNIIGKEAMRFPFLLESGCLSDAEKASYQRLIRIGTTSESIYDMTDAMLTGSLQTLSQLLEKHYGQKAILHNWLVKSSAETGEGYSDISIQTPDRIGIVIELKYADDGNLEEACREALVQIEEKKYAEGLKRWRTKKILKYGIAFYEKECMVALA